MADEKKEPILDETVIVELRGPSGNAFCVMGAVADALRRNGKGDLVAEYRRKATSGDYEQYFLWQGRRYSHILDPRSGRPLSGGVVSATVVMPGACMTAVKGSSATPADAMQAQQP